MKKVIAAISTILGIIASLCTIVGTDIKEMVEEHEVTISYKIPEKLSIILMKIKTILTNL